jgi:dihydroxyacetone kinase-like predicted kinase
VPSPTADPFASLPGHDPLDDSAGRLGGGPAFEVMFLLADSTPEAVDALRGRLDALGDSLLVVGGPDLWNVHVHVDDPGAAVEAGVAAGRPERIRITHFAAQVAAREPAPLAVVACAAGPGIARVLEQAGAVAVHSGPGHRASAGQLLRAVHATGSRTVVLLPGDRDTLMAAEVAAQAASGDGVDVHVVPARTTVQALAALAVLDPTRPVHANVVSMTGAAVATRHGAVSVATKEALTWAGVCHPGDVLGIVDGDVAFLGTELETATREVLARLLSAGGELVTLVVGADAAPGLGERVAAALERDRPDVEVVVLDGGQPVYPLLVGVE